ncbi:ornithine carbamoyltransferase [Candidatus Marinamargulisbacteria bacterium SCGC AG-343-K17]|nr:ornithine carbamoyltransferase [Candidatus Marinamargulisbacteria bacterium SCGC AG-343-K17]
MTHFIDILEHSKSDISDVLTRSIEIQSVPSNALSGKSVGLIFEKPSNRTRLSFEVGIQRLGGHAVYIKGEDIQMGDREPISHVSRVMSRYFDLIVYRTTDHARLLEFAKHSTVPVINGLSNESHPCQAVADALTIQQNFGSFESVFLTYIGDGNNVCQSLMNISQACGFDMAVVSPSAYAPKNAPNSIHVTDDISTVIGKTNVIYTDVWVSMGDEHEANQRLTAFQQYQVTSDLMRSAKDDCIFLHCLPANLGQEVTNEVFESSQSKVFDQAENRMHAQNGIMDWLMKG